MNARRTAKASRMLTRPPGPSFWDNLNGQGIWEIGQTDRSKMPSPIPGPTSATTTKWPPSKNKRKQSKIQKALELSFSFCSFLLNFFLQCFCLHCFCFHCFCFHCRCLRRHCLRCFLAVQNSSIGDLVTQSVSQSLTRWVTFWFWNIRKSISWNLWPAIDWNRTFKTILIISDNLLKFFRKRLIFGKNLDLFRKN